VQIVLAGEKRESRRGKEKITLPMEGGEICEGDGAYHAVRSEGTMKVGARRFSFLLLRV